jgi:choice-of-anchor B domain-containing protein
MRLIRILFVLILSTSSVFAQDSLNISSLFHWDDDNIPTEALYGLTYNEVWGVAINGREYGIIGSTQGTYIFDVTDPVNSVEVAFIAGAAAPVIHRDYHDYQGYLYMVADEGPSTLQIVDLSDLPNSAPVVYDSDLLFARAHNIFIDSVNGILYNTNGGVYSLANPELPVEIVNFNIGTLIDHGHDMFVKNDTVYWHGGPTGLHVYDYSIDPANPSFLGSISLGEYNHSGWLNDAGDIYVFAEETLNTDVQICDVSDLSNINIVASVNSGGGGNSIPHNVIIKGDYLYISYYHDGLYIFDISTPSSPILVGFYDTEPAPTAPYTWHGSWGVYPFLPSGNILVSDTRHGLFVLNAEMATSSLSELSSGPKELVKIVDSMGREVKEESNMMLIYIYSDGSTEKIFKVN